MVTGISNEAADFTEKHVELLLAVAPTLRRIPTLTEFIGRTVYIYPAERRSLPKPDDTALIRVTD